MKKYPVNMYSYLVCKIIYLDASVSLEVHLRYEVIYLRYASFVRHPVDYHLPIGPKSEDKLSFFTTFNNMYFNFLRNFLFIFKVSENILRYILTTFGSSDHPIFAFIVNLLLN